MGNAIYRKNSTGAKIRVRSMRHKISPVVPIKSDTFAGCYWGAMVIKSDGTLWATGISNYGQLGFGDNLQRNMFTQIGTETTWKYVSCGLSFSMAIKENGTLWATGDNTYGQLGLGDNISKNTFTQVGTETNWASVFCGGQHAIAIKKDNSVWGVGFNGQGQLGLGDIINRNSFVKIESLSDIKSVDCGANFTMVTTVENELYGTGSNNYGQLGIVGSSFLTDFTKVGSYYFWKNIACGNTWAMGSLATGLSYVAGDNEYGTLGLGDTTDRPIFVPLSGWEWKNIRPTLGSHVLAITSSGHLHSWGRNHHGQSGRGYANILSIITEPLTPIDDRTDWKRCGKTGQFSMVIDASNQLWVCGDNTFGQLGLGDTTDRWTFTDTGVIVKDIADDETSVSSGVRARGVWWKNGTGDVLSPCVQEWEGYPDSLYITALTPYQVIAYTAVDIDGGAEEYSFTAGTYLFISNAPWEHSGDWLGTGINYPVENPTMYKLSENTWEPYSSIELDYVINLLYFTVIFTNQDILEGDN